MASVCSAIACPHCGCCATEDDHYKTGEKFIWCYRCGYSYYKTIDHVENHVPIYSETVYEGHGMFLLVSKDEKRETDGRRILNRPLTEQEMQAFQDAFQDDDVDLEKSYFVTYENGEFTTIAGTVPEDFYLPFEEYKIKRGEDNLEVIVPIESLGI
ncbi:hypothetical protein SAMN04488072_11481 [Lentibacillus halodurans]|uniref:C2H2-type domain-containing protein n=1 Tax=Lentibacillus halodurans TaxID=237679 RepID=A0A1I0ZZN5_9BACI|nr:hypothetical protein [Lentibacillus halodurans]SFB30536.1 hypothetical protein SAMN04488072_11481 [Lentibacillus halodurans]